MDGCRSAPSGAAHRLDDLGSERRAGVEVEIDPLLVHSCVVSVPAPRLRTYARAAASARTHTSSASSWPSCPPFSKSSGRVAMAFVTCARVAERALDEHEEWWPGIGRDEAGRGDADQGLAARGEQLLRDQHRERRAHGAPDHSDLCVACLPPVDLRPPERPRAAFARARPAAGLAAKWLRALRGAALFGPAPDGARSAPTTTASTSALPAPRSRQRPDPAWRSPISPAAAPAETP